MRKDSLDLIPVMHRDEVSVDFNMFEAIAEEYPGITALEVMNWALFQLTRQEAKYLYYRHTRQMQLVDIRSIMGISTRTVWDYRFSVQHKFQVFLDAHSKEAK